MLHNANFLAAISVWTGACVGALKIIDWLLSPQQKDGLKDHAETAWLWLGEQRSGKFTALLLRPQVQTAFSLLAHVTLLQIVLSFAARVWFGVQINSYIELGHPRIYEFQLWVDVAALLISAVLVSWKVHPRIAAWIGGAPSLRRYFGRSAKALGLCVLVSFGTGLVQLLATGDKSIEVRIGVNAASAPSEELLQVDPERAARYEKRLGGPIGVSIVHATLALIAAPVTAESFMIMAILVGSFYWLLGIWIAVIVFRILQFILIRVVESPNGPVMALTGLLIGVGAVANAWLG